MVKHKENLLLSKCHNIHDIFSCSGVPVAGFTDIWHHQLTVTGVGDG